LTPYPYKTNYVELPGNNNVAYIDEGAGQRTLLFIHGLANYALVWKKNIDELRQHYRCIAIDLPGNGLSGKEAYPYGMKFYARSVYEFIQALGLTRLTLVGHSMGGQVALTLMLNHPAAADSMVLCAPAGFEEFSPLDKTLYSNALHMFSYFSSDEQALRQAIENSFYRQPTQGEGIIRELAGIMKTYKLNAYRKMVDASIKSMLDDEVLSRLGKITIPVLVIFGRQDALIPNKLIHHTSTERLATEAVGKMPHATLTLISDAGHFVQWEKAADVNKLIQEFLLVNAL
jgi:pimeloyl-ACP methyl ester carboxylesterase